MKESNWRWFDFSDETTDVAYEISHLVFDDLVSGVCLELAKSRELIFQNN